MKKAGSGPLFFMRVFGKCQAAQQRDLHIPAIL
jgi:hypothetical protein